MSNWVKADVIYQKEEKGGEEKGGRREPRNVWGTSLGGNLINPILNRWTLNCMGDTQVQMFKRKLGKWILHFGQRSELQTWILEAPHSGNLSGKKGKVGEDLYIFLLPKEIRRSTWKSPGALGIDHWPRLQRKLLNEWGKFHEITKSSLGSPKRQHPSATGKQLWADTAAQSSLSLLQGWPAIAGPFKCH